MAEKTEITLKYLREFRDAKIGPMLDDLREQRDALDAYIDPGGPKEDQPSDDGIRAGNPDLFPAAGHLAFTVNSSVVEMRGKLQGFIDEFDRLSERLEHTEAIFTGVEDDSVLTVQQLQALMAPADGGS
ncbi:hypothetical protein ACFO4E_29075 [Nocardiopsis mangrovi]|uniref:Uncharacterized protein n=1 Tax=Nocardiopsis mangrovi TaxID=1179818 RepID=A0ABV9E6G5_9ACTN